MKNQLRFPGTWTLDAETVTRLRLFVDRVTEFRAEGTYRYPVGCVVGIRVGGEAFSDADLPTEKDLRAAAQVARHFVLQKEPTHFERICNLLSAATSEQRFRDEIARVKKAFRDARSQRLEFDSGDPKVQTRQALVDAYFNGHYFHSDTEERSFVLSQASSPWGPLVKRDFAQALIDLFHCVQALVPTVENALGVDQLAPCPTSKRIRAVLDSVGIGPTPILVQECLSGKTTPPTVTLRCDLNIALPEKHVPRVAGAALQFMQEDRPGYPEYAVWWQDAAGQHVGVAR